MKSEVPVGFEGFVAKFAEHKALKLMMLYNLKFDERIELHLVVGKQR